jgi:hypothetical protein
MDHMRDLVQKFVQKGLLEFAYVHNLLWEYTQEALTDSNAHRMNDLVSQLAESAPKLLSTKPGRNCSCYLYTRLFVVLLRVSAGGLASVLQSSSSLFLGGFLTE